MFKNALIYRLEPRDSPALEGLEQRLAGLQFVECAASQPESAGWIAPRGDKHASLVEAVGGQLILRFCAETKAVPSSVVKDELERRLDLIGTQTGRRPKGKQAREIKDEIVQELLPRAFPKRNTAWVWMDLRAGLVWIGVASAKKADAIVTCLLQALDGGARLLPLQTQLSPATAMAQWLSLQQAPAGFGIDRECELKQPDSEKAAVRYTRHTLDIAEVGEHIRQGKQPTQLALTWASRVSFVLTDTLSLKKIKLLDVVLESATVPADREDSGFDADVAIATGELRLLIPDLIAALDGEQEADAPASVSPAAPEARPGTGGTAPWALAEA